MLFSDVKCSYRDFTPHKTLGKPSRTIQIMRDEIEQEAGERDPAEIETSTDDEESDSMELEESQEALAAYVAS
jgi:hypothetical protein